MYLLIFEMKYAHDIFHEKSITNRILIEIHLLKWTQHSEFFLFKNRILLLFFIKKLLYIK